MNNVEQKKTTKVVVTPEARAKALRRQVLDDSKVKVELDGIRRITLPQRTRPAR